MENKLLNAVRNVGMHVLVLLLIVGFVSSVDAEEFSRFIEAGEFGELVGSDVDASGENVNLAKSEGISTLELQEEGYVQVEDKVFENIEEGGFLKLDESGEVVEADFTSTESGTEYELGGKKIKVEEGSRLVYKDGKVEIFSKD